MKMETDAVLVVLVLRWHRPVGCSAGSMCERRRQGRRNVQ